MALINTNAHNITYVSYNIACIYIYNIHIVHILYIGTPCKPNRRDRGMWELIITIIIIMK